MPSPTTQFDTRNIENDNTLLPFVSYIIPTYNAERYLRRCLDSIFMQDYPKDRYEVLIAEGGSTDNTTAIAQEYDTRLINNPKRIAEYGKFLAYEQSQGEIICLLDSDNIITTQDWLSKMIRPLLQEPRIIGVESNYLIAEDFSSVNTYANLLVIVDPLARMLAGRPIQVEQKHNYLIKHFSLNTSPVSGANGFLWRKDVISSFIEHESETLEEANMLNRISSKRQVSYANVPNVGIYHYYCASLSDYITKRKKIANKFLGRKSKGEQTWVDKGGSVKLLLSALFLVSIIGPMIEAVCMIIKTRRKEWLWHPLISALTIYVYIVAVIRQMKH